MILITGGAGFIGSHTTLALLEAGYDVIVLDNLSNSSSESLRRISVLAGRSPLFIKGDIRNSVLLDQIFSDHKISAVFHFAGLKAVAESIKLPLIYYENNISGTVSLCQAMATAGVFTLVFSSSATVYGDPSIVPITEDQELGVPTNPYGQSKKVIEQILQDVGRADSRWKIALLRYFNPVGAHESGQIGEDPAGIPNNLLPYIARVATGKLASLSVFGNDYPTPDGTGVRDYIHVVDLAIGHLKSLEALQTRPGVSVWNLGTGRGYSVLDMVNAFEIASGKSIPYVIAARRPGDIAICYSDPRKANRDLNWKAERGLSQMMEDAWRWQSQHPNGYGGHD